MGSSNVYVVYVECKDRVLVRFALWQFYACSSSSTGYRYWFWLTPTARRSWPKLKRSGDRLLKPD